MDPVRYPHPAYRITLDDQDLTPKLRPRLRSLTLCLARGGEADQLDLVLDDHDGGLQIPSTGVELALWIGYVGDLVDMGTFTVDEIEHSGAPDELHIRARSANLRAELRSRTERSWHGTTLGSIVKTLAKKHGLAARVDPRLASRAVTHEDQSESDVAFLQRLAKRFDAVATVKKDRLLFLPIQGTQTSTGAPLPTITLTRAAGDQHRYHTSDRDAYTGVVAYWHDPARAKRRGVVVGTRKNAKRLRETFTDEASARAGAQAEWKRIQRGAATLQLTLALGRADLAPQTPVAVTGFKPQIDAGEWLTVKVTHTLGDGGFTTSVELENGAAAEDTGEAAEDVSNEVDE
ncbi:phage late control D family protein [Azohydromonas lata]|uniref:Phage late control D family protein n=1 Tax=Azohydromonas lata TaxID=45677 RepID=A0ABU5ID14_9BURK|nr:phage late control D family protein [Azohydromonas lata]MDZ5456986.1 phage late control D family protein [Azohydromonas lata]